MKYQEYMKQFVFLDEAKPALIARMKQRVRQLRIATETERIRSDTPAVAPVQKNTFRLHPIRWTTIFAGIALVAIVTPILAVFIPRAEPIENLVNIVKLQYMENLMVDNEGVTAYSIRKETEPDSVQSTSATYDAQSPAISLLSGRLVEKDVAPLAKMPKPYTYLYSTTESYEAGNVEYDGSGITKVTFKKNEEITKEVYDDNGRLIDADRRIHQEELDAQINRLYTTQRFTFVQYVAKVDKAGSYCYLDENGEYSYEDVYLRPDRLEYNENGTTVFDAGGYYNFSSIHEEELRISPNVSHDSFSTPIRVCNPDCPAYYSSALSSSFVIDNTTGYIYKIEGLKICGFVNNLVVDDTASVYAVSVDTDNNLVFTDVMPNKDVEVYDVFMDNEGWSYVRNNTFNEADRERKIIYYCTSVSYIQDTEGNVYIVGSLVIDGMLNPNYPTLTHKMVGGVPIPYENNGLLKLRLDLEVFSDWILGMYDNISIYGGRSQRISPTHDIIVCGFAYGEEMRAGLEVGMEGRWFDNEFNMLIGEEGGKLYYCPVDLAEYVDKLVTITSDEFILLSDLDLERVYDYSLSVGDDSYKVENVYRYKGINETKYYRVVRAETGLELKELISKSYDENVFIFQPINK